MWFATGSGAAILTILYAFFLGIVLGQVLPQLPHLLVPWSKFLRRRLDSAGSGAAFKASNSEDVSSQGHSDAQQLDSAQDLAPETPPPVAAVTQYNPWYANLDDVRLFKSHAEDDEPVPGASEWQPLLQKDTPGLVLYTSHRRTLPNGQTEYRNVTIAPDATAAEFMDFSLDDECRCRWEKFMVSAGIVEQGDFSQRQQVVRWVRTFNMSFLSDREYILARAVWRAKPDGTIEPAGKHLPGPDEVLYCVTKAIRHPAAEPTSQLVQIEEMYSMFKCRTVPCPWGSGKPACECVLLHMENMKVPERLAKVAIRFGMLGYVTQMSAALQDFVRERRSRCSPYASDPLAYGSPQRHGDVSQRTSQAGDMEVDASANVTLLGPAVPHTPTGASTPSLGRSDTSIAPAQNGLNGIKGSVGQALWKLLPRKLTNSSCGSEEEVAAAGGKSAVDLTALDGQEGLPSIAVARAANGGINISVGPMAPGKPAAAAGMQPGAAAGMQQGSMRVPAPWNEPFTRSKSMSGLAANKKSNGLERNLKYLGAAVLAVTAVALIRGRGSRPQRGRKQRQAMVEAE